MINYGTTYCAHYIYYKFGHDYHSGVTTNNCERFFLADFHTVYIFGLFFLQKQFFSSIWPIGSERHGGILHFEERNCLKEMIIGDKEYFLFTTVTRTPEVRVTVGKTRVESV